MKKLFVLLAFVLCLQPSAAFAAADPRCSDPVIEPLCATITDAITGPTACYQGGPAVVVSQSSTNVVLKLPMVFGYTEITLNSSNPNLATLVTGAMTLRYVADNSQQYYWTDNSTLGFTSPAHLNLHFVYQPRVPASAGICGTEGQIIIDEDHPAAGAPYETFERWGSSGSITPSVITLSLKKGQAFTISTGSYREKRSVRFSINDDGTINLVRPTVAPVVVPVTPVPVTAAVVVPATLPSGELGTTKGKYLFEFRDSKAYIKYRKNGASTNETFVNSRGPIVATAVQNFNPLSFIVAGESALTVSKSPTLAGQTDSAAPYVNLSPNDRITFSISRGSPDNVSGIVFNTNANGEVLADGIEGFSQMGSGVAVQASLPATTVGTYSVTPNTWASGFVKLGCFTDTWDRGLKGLAAGIPSPGDGNYYYWDNAMNRGKCVNHCKSKGFSYAAVQYGKACFCDNDYTKHPKISDASCNMPCPAGAAGETCGGTWANEIYETGLNFPPRIKEVAQEKAVALEGEKTTIAPGKVLGGAIKERWVKFDKNIAINPPVAAEFANGTGLHISQVNLDHKGTYVAQLKNAAGEVVTQPIKLGVIPKASIKPLGCYRDSWNRTMTGLADAGHAPSHTPYIDDPVKMTLPHCIQTCAHKGFTKAAVQYGRACFCDNDDSYASQGVLDIAACKNKALGAQPCPGNPAHTCGGTWANEVYEIGQPVYAE